MTIRKLEIKTNLDHNKRLKKAHVAMQNLLIALNKKELTEAVTTTVSSDIQSLNSFQGSERELKKALNKAQSKILKFVESELKFVLKNHYRSIWMVFGMILGMALSYLSGNPTYIGIGLPVGMLLGMSYGTTLDKKVEQEGRQLELEAEEKVEPAILAYSSNQ